MLEFGSIEFHLEKSIIAWRKRYFIHYLKLRMKRTKLPFSSPDSKKCNKNAGVKLFGDEGSSSALLFVFPANCSGLRRQCLEVVHQALELGFG